MHLSIKLFRSLLQQENSIEVVSKLISLFNVRATNTGLVTMLRNHPDYPSLLSISDVLNSLGVKNISLKTSVDKLRELPMPCIVPIKIGEHDRTFTILHSIVDDKVFHYDLETSRVVEMPMTNFIERWPSNIVLIADGDDAKGENDYLNKKQAEIIDNVKRIVTYSAFPFFILVTEFVSLFKYGRLAAPSFIFIVLALIGLVVSGLLVWYEYDRSNPMAQKICKASVKVNCDAILDSKAAKFLGVSWSLVGVIYFLGIIIFSVISGNLSENTHFVFAMLAMIVLPYVFFSVYYQWRIVKQWCTLCLVIQSILLLQFVIALVWGWNNLNGSLSDPFILKNLVTGVISFLIPVTIVGVLTPILTDARSGRKTEIELNKIKQNVEIFNSLLEKQKRIILSADGLGITLGNPEGTYKLIKVCSPYCGPCAAAHLPLDDLLENNPEVQLQLIFISPYKEDDLRSEIITHILAIGQSGNSEVLKQALDDWYLPEVKDYSSFAAKYPNTGFMSSQKSKVAAMQVWCEKNQISFTPTFFINGYQLPEMYTVDDLKYFLTV